MLSYYLCKHFLGGKKVAEAQSKGYFAIFTFQGLIHKVCKVVPSAQQLWFHLKVALFILLFTKRNVISAPGLDSILEGEKIL